MVIVVVGLKFIAYLVPLLIYKNLDPFYFTFKSFFESDIFNPSVGSVVFLIVRLVLSFECTFQATKMIAVFVTFGLVFLESTLTLLGLAELKCEKRRLSIVQKVRVIKMLEQCQIILSWARPYNQSSVTILMAPALLTSILSNFATLRFLFLIPFGFYLIFPTTSSMAIIVMIIGFPKSIKINTISSKLIEDLKSAQMGPFSRRYTKKKLKSLQPLSYYAGFNGFTFFRFKRTTPLTFFTVARDCFISSLLSIPQDKMVTRNLCL